MSSGEIFVAYAMPAVTPAIADRALRTKEWSIRRDERQVRG
jgi:hypothetical protein